MRVIICGAGRVGYGIAARLASEHNTVTVVDVSADLVRTITTDLDVRGITGHGAYPDVLKEAGIESADMIIAVTYSDEVNMIACQIAHSLFNVPTKVARVRAQSYLESEWNDLYSRENMPIDIIISPEMEIGKSILRRLHMPGAFEVVPFADNAVKMLGVKIHEDCPIIATPIRQIPDLFPELQATIVGIRREQQIFVPTPDDPLYVGDDAFFIVKSEHANRLLEIVGTSADRARHIVVIGGGNIGVYVASELESVQGIRCRVIERNKERAELAAEKLSKTVVLNGDAMNSEIQQEAGVADAELVLCLTNDDKTNILAGVLAKKIGANQAVSLVNDPSIQSLANQLPINRIVDPRAATVSSILRHVRRGRILDVFTFSEGLAEVIEGEVLDTSLLVGKKLEDIKLNGIALGAIIQDGVLAPMDANLVVKKGDHVVLLAEKSAFKQVEQVFRVGTEYF
ncbi:MAG: Trk system potassium transporter TrkA [Hellea sp.]|nr:Trk system potassium transporter TrkA [Hellea sp.]